MTDNQFIELPDPPDAATLKKTLGSGFAWYEGVLEAAKGFKQDWKHYGRKYGWKLKSHDGSKALFELTVLSRGFLVGMAVRELELEALRADPALALGLGGLLDSEKSREGWGIRILVDTEEAYARAVMLIRAVATIRQKG